MIPTSLFQLSLQNKIIWSVIVVEAETFQELKMESNLKVSQLFHIAFDLLSLVLDKDH